MQYGLGCGLDVIGCGTEIVVRDDRSLRHSILRGRLGSVIDVRRIGGVFMFNPGLKIGHIIKNADIVGIILKAKILRRINISGVN